MSPDIDGKHTLELVLLLQRMLTEGVTRPFRYRAAICAVDDALELWTDWKRREDAGDVGLCAMVRGARDAVAAWAAGKTSGAPMLKAFARIEQASGRIRQRAQSVRAAEWDFLVIGSVVRLLSAANAESAQLHPLDSEDPDANIGFAVIGAAAVVDGLRPPPVGAAHYLVEWTVRVKLLDADGAPRSDEPS